MTQKKTPDPTKAESSAPNIAQFIATREEFNALRSAYAQRFNANGMRLCLPQCIFNNTKRLVPQPDQEEPTPWLVSPLKTA